jgi:hypothetical protein
MLAESLRQGEQADAVEFRTLQHPFQPDRPLGPPVAEQLGVDCEDAEAAVALICAVALEAVANGGQERGGVLGGSLGGDRRLVRPAGDGPEAHPIL